MPRDGISLQGELEEDAAWIDVGGGFAKNLGSELVNNLYYNLDVAPSQQQW